MSITKKVKSVLACDARRSRNLNAYQWAGFMGSMGVAVGGTMMPTWGLMTLAVVAAVLLVIGARASDSGANDSCT